MNVGKNVENMSHFSQYDTPFKSKYVQKTASNKDCAKLKKKTKHIFVYYKLASAAYDDTGVVDD